jgi:hypothetical protein
MTFNDLENALADNLAGAPPRGTVDRGPVDRGRGARVCSAGEN